MSDERKKITVDVNAKTHAILEEYCDHTGQDIHRIANYLFAKSLDEFAVGYKSLKEGYVEMGQLNLEISNAFSVSENEALNHVDYLD